MLIPFTTKLIRDHFWQDIMRLWIDGKDPYAHCQPGCGTNRTGLSELLEK